jgi:hypothetical protein
MRKSMLHQHLGHALGADIQLNEAEQQFNAILMVSVITDCDEQFR